MNEELKEILTRFSECGWDLIDSVSKAYLNGADNRAELEIALKQADEQCGSCGCEFDPLYQRALALLAQAER